jgi:pimeloyl-ACP methyl ester carboxylesterase
MKIFRALTLAVVLITVGGLAARAAPVEQDISFHGSGGVVIAGTLTLPESASDGRRVPAVLLMQGSGPTDRDGNQGPALRPDLLRQLAEVLAEEDIASLRFDKRGMHANRSTLPARQDELSAFFEWSAFVGDARQAFAFLTAHPTIAANRVGVVAHSEGGLIALDMAARYSPQPRALVLTATAGRPIGQVIRDQLSAALDQQQATEQQRQFFLDADQRIQAEILASGKVPANIHPGLAALYPSYAGSFLKSQLALDPIVLAAQFNGPILVITGTADVQVSATRDAGRFAAALAQRKDGSEVVTPPDVTHNLKTVVNNDDPGVTGKLDSRVKDRIVHWLKLNL